MSPKERPSGRDRHPADVAPGRADRRCRGDRARRLAARRASYDAGPAEDPRRSIREFGSHPGGFHGGGEHVRAEDTRRAIRERGRHPGDLDERGDRSDHAGDTRRSIRELGRHPGGLDRTRRTRSSSDSRTQASSRRHRRTRPDDRLSAKHRLRGLPEGSPLVDVPRRGGPTDVIGERPSDRRVPGVFSLRKIIRRMPPRTGQLGWPVLFTEREARSDGGGEDSASSQSASS